MYEFLAILGFLLFIFVIIGIGLYIVYAYSLYKMAVKQGLENPWIAWIPIAQNYTLGKLIKTLKVFDIEIPRIEIFLPVASLVVCVFNRIEILGALLSLANYILVLFALNKLYKMYKPENATLYTVLSIFGITVPFIFLTIKDLEPVIES
ncbi:MULTISPECIES: hypothetical protein [unclassified Clostridium]|uniref:hypothetical protein n=1 Tax=unclassified Clostridium TaxID=2614128 RepID=UPI000297B99B|nr:MULTISPECIES: hypothetical protein [unclassified Clostridium]EKQ53515.1 MAG: hypothetical protein A370_03696 [Clostridium sp. Maddingley MBC34-26]